METGTTSLALLISTTTALALTPPCVGEKVPVDDEDGTKREYAMTDLISDRDPPARQELATLGQGPLNPQEKRILVNGGAAISIPGLIPHLAKILTTPVSDVEWINTESTSIRHLLYREPSR